MISNYRDELDSQPLVSKDNYPGRVSLASPLANDAGNDDRLGWHRRRQWALSYRPPRSVTLLLLTFCAIMLLRKLTQIAFHIGVGNFSCTEDVYRPLTPAMNLPEDVHHNWAQYSPYHPEGLYDAPTKGCNIDQVNILLRHGARYPTEGAGSNIQRAVKNLQAADDFSDDRLKFLRNYSYDLGEENLVHFGAAQSFDAGQEHFRRYGHLLNGKTLPFLRASGSGRVIESAKNWISGVSFASHFEYNATLNVIVSESSGSNNTLDDDMCPNAGDSDPFKSVWQELFASPIRSRFHDVAPGSNLTNEDIPHLMSLCSFETLAEEELSPFCALFSRAEFEDYEYFHDLDKYYKTGYGQPLGPIQGVGYVNELLARLTNKPVQDNTQTNRTLDSSPDTFPLGLPFYIDFSHDNEMIAIYAALGLFRQKGHLNVTSPDIDRSWRAAKLVPFSARMVVERLNCGGERFVRIFVNDARQPMEFCDADDNGMCHLSIFVASQSYSTNDGEGDFEKCYE